MRDVATAVIVKDGKILICQRPPHKGNALKWEFVGGKREEGETLEETLIRECKEELDIKVSVGEKITDVVHAYPDMTYRITLFHAEITEGTPRLLEHVDMKWINPEDIDTYDFCTADTEILKKVKYLSGKDKL